MKKTCRAFAAGLLAAVAVSTAPASAQPTVTRVVVVAKPPFYNGPCPAPMRFIGTIFVEHPARVAYRWERSDGVSSPRQVVSITSAGRGVSYAWTLGRSYEGTVRLHVLAPTGIASDDAAFRVRCT